MLETFETNLNYLQSAVRAEYKAKKIHLRQDPIQQQSV